MDLKRACRLCLDFAEDFVDIFQDFEDTTIATICKDDGFSDFLCQACWTNTKTFHNFYKNVETRQTNYLQSIGFVEQHSFDSLENVTTNNLSHNVIKLEQSQSPEATVDQTNEYIVKTEEMYPTIVVKSEEIMDSTIAFDLQIQREESLDFNYDPSESADSEGNSRTDDEDQSPKVKRKLQRNDVCESKNSKLFDSNESSLQPLSVSAQTTNQSKNARTRNTSQADTAKEDAEIREFFNMKCDICDDYQFETFVEAKKHYQIVHNTVGYLICCGNKFRRRPLAVDHIHRHLNPDAYRCDSCGKLCANKTTLKNHMENHETRAFKCSMCSSSFNKQWKLADHERRYHRPKEERKFRCDQCNKILTSEASLSYHIRCMHKLAFAHLCDICAKVFKNEHRLKHHMLQHSTVIQPKVQCDVCSAWFKNKEGLRKHKQQKHRDTFANCPICNKVFPNKHCNHIRCVHGERKHQCTICDKAFRKALHLKEHMALHTGEVLYNCQYCTKPFKSKQNMDVHKKTKHLTEWTRDRSTVDSMSTEIPGQESIVDAH